MSEQTTPRPYVADKAPLVPSSDELRARIPGWGADLHPADRPSFPRERLGRETGAHWDFPERQPETEPRERSIEHAFVTPVFGTTLPPRGLSGAIRKYSYRRFGEGRAVHWLLLIAADRVDSYGSHLRSFATLRPDNPITQTGVLGEIGNRPVSSRFGRKRVDTNHSWLDPIIVAGPWVATGWAAFRGARRVVRLVRR